MGSPILIVTDRCERVNRVSIPNNTMMIANNMFAIKITLLTDRLAKIPGLLLSSKLEASTSSHDRHQLANDYSTVDLIAPVPPYDDPLY